MRVRTLPTLVAALAATGYLHTTAPAAACSAPPTRDTLFFEVPSSVPVDGVVLIRTSCDTTCPTDPIFEVSDASGNVVTGNVVQTLLVQGDTWLVWKSQTNLAEGESYSVALLDTEELEYEAAQHIFQAVTLPTTPSSSWHVTDIAARAVLEGETVCCKEGERDSCNELPCYLVPSSVHGVVNALLETPERADGSQYLYRVQPQDGERWMVGNHLFASFALAEKYCYEIEALDLATGAVQTVAQDCISGAEVTAPDLELALGNAQVDLFRQCTVPPAGYEDVWCRTYAQPRRYHDCAEQYPLEACEAALNACPSLVGQAGSTGLNFDEVITSDERDRGCTMGSSSSSGLTLPGMLAALALAGSRMRRRIRNRRG
ncbi:MAG TPA: hypothetical protein VFQ61_38780 [Polyangiaceae bacterium]|nr:hypothetical protein [Polyangiaceae bacterium]